ncbi:CoA transferase [Mycobacterium sp. MS1601]|uniref:CaiB/BaiF CoA-transferase family protein n=1 Tax=Mycobacterium sp. MS1601 TaxID=1936029 RepID=UPI0009796520|nr:CoA transferase [Mycobacterium sp. MS1601]AQA05337.1 CoA transferase [Mycobacterium sp. MS1601]
MPTVDTCQLLQAVRVLDLAAGGVDIVSRLLADLGADVLKVEPPGGSPERTAPPSLGGTGIAFALHNANKRSVVLDPAEAADRKRLVELAAGADIVVDSGLPGQAAAYGIDAAELADRFPQLVVIAVTDFGVAGPRASWQASDAVLYALSSALSRSGPPVGAPVLPPDGIATATAAVQAAWAVLVAYYHRLRCGQGDFIDFSRLEAVVSALDPPFGSHGQAAAGMRRGERWRGRPQNQDAYPIIACRDGYVRLVVMAPRQWRGLRAWMGEPEEFQDPRFDVIAERFAEWDRIGAVLAEQFAGQSMAELVAAGQSHGVPIAEVLDPTEALDSEHFRAVGASTVAELTPGVQATVPLGYYTVDGARAGLRTPAPSAGADEPRWLHPPTATSARSDAGLPFEGLRIVDLGIIVAGGELSRLFADLGAEVIKVESRAYPDGLRQARAGDLMSESFAWTHRNKLGLGLELRSEAGADVFTRLVADADAVFANFKPGTLAALGFSYHRLQQINPDLVLAESSAYGDTGPWSTRMGYGPLVRSGTGVTRLWTAPPGHGEPVSQRHRFFDATTVFPDHVVGRITAIGALAALIHRDRTGTGARLHVSQAEACVSQLDAVFVAQAAGAPVVPDPVHHGVYPCAGDDEWCVISLRDADRDTLAGLTSGAELSQWTAARSPVEVAEALQAVGIAAAPMLRRMELLEDPQLVSRGFFQPMHHPLFDIALPSETGPAPFRAIGHAPTRPAPLPGQDTREICQKTLGFDDVTIQRLIDDGVLFSSDPPEERSR